jgi:hypothetical protein
MSEAVMPIWLSLLITIGAAIIPVTSAQNIVHELRSGSLRPKLLFWVLPGWTSKRHGSPQGYWLGIVMDIFRTCFFGAVCVVAAALARQGFFAS